ncbi:right-handed parallel beta-helix repeat-containing protein [Streptomyces sp. NPDC093094]|uniref:right-handed parallel beta-helix repeat-containing protein n=1 Tax=Streptomyces sp. NPDC093094 TaxID=3366026 RepID=UPI0037F70659
MLPLLSHIAELVAEKTELNDDDLAMLVYAAGLEEQTAVATAELRRWSVLLTAARQATALTTRAIAARSLTLRGIPDGAARLAVDVATSAAPPPLSAIPTTVSLGVLPLGAPGRAEITVHGGPGTAIPGSSDLSVEPGTFGPGETILRVQAAPAHTERLLWETITLETGSDRLVIDVTGRWIPESDDNSGALASDKALPAGREKLVGGPSSLTFDVSPTGPEGHRTITAALTAAPPGSTIRVHPGHYQEALVLDRPITLTGEGPSEDIIIEVANEPCITARAALATVRGLTLKRLSGAQGGPCIDVPQGRLTLERCEVTSDSQHGIGIQGAQTSAEITDCRIHNVCGSGVNVFHGSQVTIQNCLIDANRTPAGTGISIAFAGVSVRDSRIFNCQESGIYLADHGRGLVENCHISSNGGPGVSIENGSDASMRSCRIDHGHHRGVEVRNHGGVTVEDCDIYANAFSGILIVCSEPTFRNCRIRDNGANGVSVRREGRGVVEDCQIYANSYIGVAISETGSNPTIRNCHIRDGKGGGVAVSAHGRGTIDDCDIYANTCAGIDIKTGGNPVVQNCRIHDGKENGVRVHNEGRGTFEECDIDGNALHGISISSGGEITVQNCHIRHGKLSGVIACDRGRGTLENCQIYANGGAGVYFKGPQTRATLHRNRINLNDLEAIWICDGGGVDARDNDLTGNKRGPWDIDMASKPHVHAYRNLE